MEIVCRLIAYRRFKSSSLRQIKPKLNFCVRLRSFFALFCLFLLYFNGFFALFALLYLFSLQKNGSYHFDYASFLHELFQ